MNILECKNLTKSYKKNHPVLDNLNLTIPSGKIIGLLGPNGCGKSTLIKLVSGLLQADSGEILIDSMPIGDKTNAIISYLPERTYFNSWMRVSQLIDYFAEFYEDFDAIGSELNKLQTTYDKATNRLKQGERNRSIVNSGEKLKKLGVRMAKQRQLPLRLQITEE
jgi:ABC-2 type transport system ATP-binding protein